MWSAVGRSACRTVRTTEARSDEAAQGTRRRRATAPRDSPHTTGGTACRAQRPPPRRYPRGPTRLGERAPPSLRKRHLDRGLTLDLDGERPVRPERRIRGQDTPARLLVEVLLEHRVPASFDR